MTAREPALVRIVAVESLDHEGQGIAHVEGKVVFIEGALPGEIVEIEVRRRRPSYDVATTTRVISESSQRVTPRGPSALAAT